MRRAFFWIASWLLAVPVAVWAWHHSRCILRCGHPLTAAQLRDARAAGVARPARIRIMAVPQVPNPLQRLSGPIGLWTPYSIFQPAGMTLHYGIFVVRSLAGDRELLAHEFAHVAQYERAAGIIAFMRRYIFQCLADGYLEAPFEAEAREISHRICHPQA